MTNIWKLKQILKRLARRKVELIKKKEFGYAKIIDGKQKIIQNKINDMKRKRPKIKRAFRKK